jgi:nitrite reductase/ring-hydroxylating ferredoxin subunit
MADDEQPSAPHSPRWHKVAAPDALADDAVMPAFAGEWLIALTRMQGNFGALDNTCPHAGGPLSEGCIEDGVLVCPWHGREYHPVTGEPQGHAQPVRSYPVEIRADGIYVFA